MSATAALRSLALSRGREPVLPVRKVLKAGSNGSTDGRRHHASRGRRSAALSAAAWILLVALLIAGIAVAAAGWYVYSILYEAPAAVEAAAAEAQQAAAAAAAARPAEQQRLNTTAYTVVVMSYVRRLSTLPLVVNKLASCPSVAEVLLVWNGEGVPSKHIFQRPERVRIRREPKTDLSNRMRPDPNIGTSAIFSVDDDLLLRCADVERAFARWQANQDAIVGFFPRLVASQPPQYLGEKVVFGRRRYSAVLTGAAFVSLDLLHRYWSQPWAEGRALVQELTNCEDLLFNFVAATTIKEKQQQQQQQQQQEQQGLSEGRGERGGAESDVVMQKPQEQEQQQQQQEQQEQQQGRRLRGQQLAPHAVWSQPSRRLDISSLSGVGLSKGRGMHEAKRRQCMAKFGEWYGRDLLQEQPVEWEESNVQWRLLQRPLCSLPFLGCIYL